MDFENYDPFVDISEDYDDEAEDIDDTEGIFDVIGAGLTGGLSLLPKAAKALGAGRRPRTASGRGYSSGIRGRSGATLRTPAGNASIRFPANMVTKEELNKALAKVGEDIKKNASAIVSTNKKIDAATVSQVNGFRKIEGKLDGIRQNNMMQSMMSMMMQPELESITFEKAPTAGTAAKVTNSDYETNLLPMVMGMMGGSGGKDSDSMMMMAMAMMMKD